VKTSNVYVGGFNLYYGALKDTRHKWLDLQKVFERLRPDDDVGCVRRGSRLSSMCRAITRTAGQLSSCEGRLTSIERSQRSCCRDVSFLQA